MSPSKAISHPVPWVMLSIFVICAFQPFMFTVGTTTLSPLRVLLLVTMVPTMLMVFSGRAGRVIASDYVFLVYSLWTFLAAVMNNDLRIPFLLSHAIETLGAYFLARVLIRDIESFRAFLRIYLFLVLAMLPFAVIESLTHVNPLVQLYTRIPGIDVFPHVNHPPRLGLFRAQGPFEHPILFGLVCGFPFAMAWMVLVPETGSWIRRLFWSMISGVGVFFSLSSGALFAVIAQGALLSYDLVLRQLRQRWKLFAVLAVLGYIALDLVTESTPIKWLVANATLSPGSAWNRIRIWELGTAEVARHPIFGMGFDPNWERPSWMLSSVDNYWLVVAMRYGIPGFALFILPILLILWRLLRKDLSWNSEIARCRVAYMIAMGGATIALATVFIWGATYVIFVFIVGASVWMTYAEPQQGEPSQTSHHLRDVPERKRVAGTSRSATSRATPRTAKEGHAGPDEVCEQDLSVAPASRRKDIVYSRSSPKGGLGPS